MYHASGCVFAPFGSYFNERFSYRFTAILGSILGIIGFFLASLSSKLWMMYLTYGVLSGIGHVMIFNCSYLIVLQYFVKWRSVAVGIVASAPAIGMFAMTQFTELILSRFGWQGTLLGFGFLHVVAALCSTVFVPLEDTKGKRKNENTVGELIKYQQERLTNDAPLYRNPSFLIMLSSFVVVMFVYFVPTVHIVSTFRYFVFNLVYFMNSL